MSSYTALLVCFFLFVAIQSTRSDGQKVVLGFYGESLCPDCIAFSNGPLTEAFSEIPTIFTLDYVPWGNAKLLSSGDFECQHGEMECTMNTVEACALDFYPNMTIFWPFLHCLYGYSSEQNPAIGKKCAMAANMNWDQIDACSTGSLGHKLELGYANKTSSLQPPHRYTPWITINGKHDTRAEESGLVKVICDAFLGQEKPDACKN